MAATGKLYTVPGVGQTTVARASRVALYSNPTFYSQIKATAAVAGVELEEPVYKHHEDDEMPEFPVKFSCGRIPTCEGAEGFNLTEGAAIARYIASVAPNSGLPGGTAEGTALIDQYIHAALPESQLRGFSAPEAILLARTYLVDERLTLADIAVACVIFLSVSHTLDAPLRNRYPNVLRHLDLIIDQPKLKDVLGQPTFVEKARAVHRPAKEKEEKEPKQPAPAPAIKKEKPKKAEEDDEGDENRNPKTPLISHQNRHSISRTGNALVPTRTRAGPVALECFCENFDNEGFSIYRVDAKHNAEVSVVFMSFSHISGFFNRLEASPKYLFGSVGITRAANDSIITGILILRVKMSKPVVKIASIYESCDCKKLDMENTEDKAFFEGALTWDLEIDNKKCQAGKNFK
ncbi:hypothetical protein EDD16DRAFT_1702732 [Pisolithus croceorrhizus]|nr:hypothetical protein EDD16DRAFT_1702732 [Pisolithus croceorrhizus]